MNRNAMLRHTVATVAYRSAKAVRGAADEFADFRVREGTRTPVEILAHCGDLLDWALQLADGGHAWRDSTPLPWDQETARFFSALHAFDRRLASDAPLACPAEKLFQGPVADALTHIGQINMLRRMAGFPVKGENYFQAEIVAGRLGPAQAKAAVEFD